MFKSSIRLLFKQSGRLLAPKTIIFKKDQPADLFKPIASIFLSLLTIYLSYSFSQSNLKLSSIQADSITDYQVEPDKKTATFQEVRGISEVKSELVDLVDMIKNREKYFKIGAKLPRGILLTGEPGTGKTLLARAVAGEANVTFFSACGSEFDEVFVGIGASRIRELFKEAKQYAPSVIFIDEIDTLGAARMQEGNVDKQQATLNQLLVEMDGFEDHENIIVIAATNMVSDMDPALLRPGRFDKEISVPVPNKADRIEIFEYYLSKVQSDPAISLENLAGMTTGFTGADISNMVNTSLLLAVKDGRHACNELDLEAAKDRILLGIASPNIVRSKNRKYKIAIREACTALALIELDKNHSLDKVSILKRGNKQGKSSALPKKDSISITKQEIFERAKIRLAAAAGENLFYNKGKNTDYLKESLAQVSEFLRSSFMQGLLEEELGLLFFKDFKKMSLRRQNLIDRTTSLEVDRCFREIQVFLSEKERIIKSIANELVEKETLTRQDIENILKNS